MRALGLVLCLALLAAPAMAVVTVPAPGTSTVPQCLVACPQGDIPFQVVVRDLAGNPIVNSIVSLDLSLCPQVQVCPVQGPGVIWDIPTRTLRALTDVTGQVTFGIRAGGLCPGSGVRVLADGVLLTFAPLPVASPDQDANLAVYGNDRELLENGGYDPGKDLDCDGLRDAADVAIIEAHMGHLCDAVVPVQPRAWGTLKLRYR